MAKRVKSVHVARSTKGGAWKVSTDRAASKTSSITFGSIKSAAARAQHRGDIHVVPFEGGWAVRRQGTSKEAAHFSTKTEAVDSARRVARESGSGLIVHGRDGRVRSKDSYGTDPMPPKDRK